MYGVVFSSGGIPLIYLGDEVGTLNDPDYINDPGKAGDSRWVHRPARDAARYAQRNDPTTDAGRIYHGLRRMIDLRKRLPAIDGGELTSFWTHNPSVLGYLREGDSSHLLVLGNFSEFEQTIAAPTFSAMPETMLDLIGNSAHGVRQGITLAPYQMVWLIDEVHH